MPIKYRLKIDTLKTWVLFAYVRGAARNANHLVYYMTAIHTNKLLLNGWFKIIAVVNLKV